MVDGAASPALAQIRKRLGRRLVVHRSDRLSPRRRNPGRFDLLIVDGDVLSARPGGSRAFLFRVSQHRRGPVVTIFDAARLSPLGIGALDKRRRSALRRQETGRVAALVTRRVTGRRGHRRGRATVSASEEIPAEAQRGTWRYSQPGSAHPPDGYWYYLREGRSHNITPRRSRGHRTVKWTVNHTFTAYLDKDNHPEGNFQIVTYDLDGTVQRRQPGESFFRMFDPGSSAPRSSTSSASGGPA